MDSPVLLFDGVCNLCNGLVKFILKHEKNPVIRFAALQSEAGKKYLEKFKVHEPGLKSIIFVDDNFVYQKSAAAFKIASYLKSPWSWTGIFQVLPRSFSDSIYNIIAKYRYKVFGRSDTCMMPDEDYQSRFLD